MKKVMVVDDEMEMLEYIKTGLEMSGYEVFTTANALDAIELAHTMSPDVIVLDIVMPGIDGYSIYRGLSVSNITKDIPVIFMTGNMSPELRQKIVQTKAYCCLLKPFDITALAKRVNDALVAHPAAVKS